MFIYASQREDDGTRSVILLGTEYFKSFQRVLLQGLFVVVWFSACNDCGGSLMAQYIGSENRDGWDLDFVSLLKNS